MAEKRAFTVPEEEQGSRLDAFLARRTEYGVRAVKRLAADGAVTIDGRTRPAHFKLLAGAAVFVEETPPPLSSEPLAMAAASKDYLALVKPAGCDTARIAGTFGPSLEQSLAAQWEEGKGRLSTVSFPLVSFLEPLAETLAPFLGGPMRESAPAYEALPVTPPALLTRLDAATSGLVLAALTPAAELQFRSMERGGAVSKYYLAVVHGAVTVPFAVPNALDTDNRKKTRVLAVDTADRTRHSEIVPVGPARECGVGNAPAGTTLLAVRIRRGARHQIRAHLAHAGFPLLGDPLYGRKDREDAFLHLHHARVIFPEFSAFAPPPWLVP